MPSWPCRARFGRPSGCVCSRCWFPPSTAVTRIAIRPCHPMQPSERLPSTPYRKSRCTCRQRLVTTPIFTAAGNMLQMVRNANICYMHWYFPRNDFTYLQSQVCFCFYALSNATHLYILFYIQKHTLAITKLVPCSGERTTLSSPTGFTYQSAITADRPQFVSVARPSRGHADSCRRTETTRSRVAHMVPAV